MLDRVRVLANDYIITAESNQAKEQEDTFLIFNKANFEKLQAENVILRAIARNQETESHKAENEIRHLRKKCLDLYEKLHLKGDEELKHLKVAI